MLPPASVLSLRSVALAVLILCTGCDSPEGPTDPGAPSVSPTGQPPGSNPGTPAGSQREDTSVIDTLSQYFPMDMGNTWIYDSQDGPDVVFEIVAIESIGAIRCHKVNRRIGDEVIPFYLSVTKKGVVIHKVGDDVYDPPFLEFSFPMTKEDRRGRSWRGTIGPHKYEITTKNLGKDTVKLHGRPKSAIHVKETMLRVQTESTAQGTSIQASHFGFTDFWIVEGIGVVKLVGKEPDPHNTSSREYSWTLKSFEKAK